MSRFSPLVKDADGNLFIFEQNEEENGTKALETYPMVVKWLKEKGFEPVNIDSLGKKSKPIVEMDGKVCPKCGKKVWDNRERIQSGQFNPKAPHFACEDKETCKFAVWEGQYKLV